MAEVLPAHTPWKRQPPALLACETRLGAKERRAQRRARFEKRAQDGASSRAVLELARGVRTRGL